MPQGQFHPPLNLVHDAQYILRLARIVPLNGDDAITELTPQRTTGVMTCAVTVHNQAGELVLEGWHRYLIRKRPAMEEER